MQDRPYFNEIHHYPGIINSSLSRENYPIQLGVSIAIRNTVAEGRVVSRLSVQMFFVTHLFSGSAKPIILYESVIVFDTQFRRF